MIGLFKERKVTTTVRDKLTEAEFIELLKIRKPSEIWNMEYSSKQPLYTLTNYTNTGVYHSCAAYSDKTPVFVSFKRLYKACKNGMTSCYIK